MFGIGIWEILYVVAFLVVWAGIQGWLRPPEKQYLFPLVVGQDGLSDEHLACGELLLELGQYLRGGSAAFGWGHWVVVN
jgi:hypothetical protein